VTIQNHSHSWLLLLFYQREISQLHIPPFISRKATAIENLKFGFLS